MSNISRKVIINADDFGYSPGVTAGILHAHRFGVLTSTTAMVNMPFAKHAIKMAENYPKLGIGLHFVLDIGRPVLPYVNSLTDSTGMFLKGEPLIESAEKDDIKAELEAQLNLLFNWGVDVTHIDSHHHMHRNILEAREAVTEVARQYKLPVRSLYDNELPSDIILNNHFTQDFYGKDNVSIDSLIRILSKLKKGVTEIMSHPAFIDPWVYDGSRYNLPRMEELKTLVDKRIYQWVKTHDIQLINYGSLKREVNK